MIDIELPDLGGHPPAPTVALVTFEHRDIEVFIPQAIARGELTQESAIADFMNSEGRMKESRF